jgi:pyruvate,water dikinase
MPGTPRFTLDFAEITIHDHARVGGKNASLGELYRALRPHGVGVVDGFAVTAEAYQHLLGDGVRDHLRRLLGALDPDDLPALARAAEGARRAVLGAPVPPEVRDEVRAAYEALAARLGREPELAVRSSATLEDLPEASFAGAAETFLNVRGPDALIDAVHHCFASLFTDRAISYRARLGYEQLDVSLSVGVMPMVRSDLGSAGVIFTLDPDSGFSQVIVVTGSYGLGVALVQGLVIPDEWTVFKPSLGQAASAIIGRRLGTKELRTVYAASGGTRHEPTPSGERRRFSLRDDEVHTLARWATLVEAHYSRLAGRAQPMDLEWAKDGRTGELFVLQARPETVHSTRPASSVAETHRLGARPGLPLVTGQAIGDRIAAGRVRVVPDLGALSRVEPGDVLVAPSTDPDWEPAMRHVAGIVTDQGGRTAHAAIVSRELGLPCIVGTGRATRTLQDGQEVTVCCAEGPEGRVYAGRLPVETERFSAASVPRTRTALMLIVGDPSRAFAHAAIPSAGVGLARLEFIIASHIGVHPLALLRHPRLADPAAVREIEARIGDEDPREFFVQRLAEGVARIAAAFSPRPVIVRTTDFKSNEYAQLVGGREFEPDEENPMLGLRGASRYYDPVYAEAFALECRALARVRDDLGLTNVKVMIPFCRTVEEARRVIALMAGHGLRQGERGLEVYGMCELPTNVILADEFLSVFDGYSIGSNDLTQLTLGLDRDSRGVAHLFDERDEAVRRLIRQAIQAARRAGKPIGICGQAPSDYPDFAAWLVECGITSIAVTPDAILTTARSVAAAEASGRPAVRLAS